MFQRYILKLPKIIILNVKTNTIGYLKECYEFPDYTFEQHFGKPMPSYIPRELFR